MKKIVNKNKMELTMRRAHWIIRSRIFKRGKDVTAGGYKLWHKFFFDKMT